MPHSNAPKKTNDSAGKEILVRSEGMSGASFLRLEANGSFQAARGGKYVLVDPVTLEEVAVTSLRQDGEALIVLLDDGRILTIEKYFEVDNTGQAQPIAHIANSSELGGERIEYGGELKQAGDLRSHHDQSLASSPERLEQEFYPRNGPQPTYAEKGRGPIPPQDYMGWGVEGDPSARTGYAQSGVMEMGYNPYRSESPFERPPFSGIGPLNQPMNYSMGRYGGNPMGATEYYASPAPMGDYGLYPQTGMMGNGGYSDDLIRNGLSYGTGTGSFIQSYGGYALAALAGVAITGGMRSSSTGASNDVLSSAITNLSESLDERVSEFATAISDGLADLEQQIANINSGDSNGSTGQTDLDYENLSAAISDGLADLGQQIANINGGGSNGSNNNSTIEGLQALVQSLISMLGTLGQGASGAPITINNITGSDNSVGTSAGTSGGTVNPQDSVAPTILSVANPDGVSSIMMGDTAFIDIKFSESIQLNGDGNDLGLTLSNGQTAQFEQQIAADTLRFSFLAETPDPQIITVTQVSSNTTKIVDAAGNNANTTVIGKSSNLFSIDELKIESIQHSFPEDGLLNTQNNSEEYTIDLKYSDVVLVDSEKTNPYLVFNGGSTSVAEYLSGSGTDVLKFRYTVQEGQFATPLTLIGLVDNGAIQSSSGVIAKDYTDGLFATDVVVDTKKPSIVDYEISNETLGNQIETSGGEDYVTYTSTIRLNLDENVNWAAVEGYTIEDFPYLEVNGVVESLETLDSAKAIFSLDNLNGTNYILFEISGYVNKYIYDNGEAVPLQLFTTSNIYAQDLNGNALDKSIPAGAGRFVLGSVDLLKVAEAAGLGDQDSQAAALWELFDLNGLDGNYKDEVSGDIVDLSTQMGAESSLRTISIDGTDRPGLVATPLSELAIRIIENFGIEFSDPNALSFFEKFSEKLGVENIFEEELAFANEKSFEDLVVNGSAYNYAVILSAMSAFDNVTGSIELTLDALQKMFFEGSLENSVLFSAAEQKVQDSLELSEHAKSATIAMISKFSEMSGHFSFENGLIEVKREVSTIINDDMSDVFLLFSDGSTIEIGNEDEQFTSINDSTELALTIPDSGVDLSSFNFFQNLNQTSDDREG